MSVCVKPTFPKQSIIQAKHFCSIFPYHLVFDRDFEIKQCGTMIQVLLKLKLEKGTQMTSLFKLSYPRVDFTLDNLQAFINSAFLLSSIKERNGHPLVLKGNIQKDNLFHVLTMLKTYFWSWEDIQTLEN